MFIFLFKGVLFGCGGRYFAVMKEVFRYVRDGGFFFRGVLRLSRGL